MLMLYEWVYTKSAKFKSTGDVFQITIVRGEPTYYMMLYNLYKALFYLPADNIPLYCTTFSFILDKLYQSSKLLH